MKKLFLLAPIIGAIALNSCKKETETVTETVTITQTDTVYVNITDTVTVNQTDTIDQRLAIVVEEFEQIEYQNLGSYSSVDVSYFGLNLSDEQLPSTNFTIEALANDGDTYTATGWLFDLYPNIKDHENIYIDTEGKKCLSVTIKSVNIGD